jgi:hypothetical protein
MGEKVPKGGQTTFLMDIHHPYPRAYIHRHKLQNPKNCPDGFSCQGPAKVIDIVKQIDGLIDGTDPACTETVIPNTTDVWKYPKNKIYQLPPHITADNHFSGDNTMKFMGSKGYGFTVTCCRDCFPVGIKQYLTQEKIKAVDKMAKAMSYENPIVAVRQVEAKNEEMAYTENIVSFQSTGRTNISGVNNLPSLQLFVKQRERGRGADKRVWAIEQNEAHETYLNHYYGMDVANHMIKNTANKYIT